MTRAESFEPLPEDIARKWSKFGNWEREFFQTLVGLQVEEVRTDYCRMRLPFRKELEQPAGVVHGGVLATLLDSVVVPAVGAAYGREVRYSTVDMHVQFMAALVEDDAIGEGWVVKRGRSIVFCESEVCAATTGKVVARAVLTFSVSG